MPNNINSIEVLSELIPIQKMPKDKIREKDKNALIMGDRT